MFDDGLLGVHLSGTVFSVAHGALRADLAVVRLGCVLSSGESERGLSMFLPARAGCERRCDDAA